MKKLDPITWVLIGTLSAFVGGFFAGRSSKDDSASEVLAAHSQSLDTILDGQTEILSEVNKPVVIDAELRSKLADIPVQCLRDLGGDPTSVECQWATCLQYGQSSAQRPECSQILKVMVEELQQPEAPPAP